MTGRSRRELKRAIERLEASTPADGEYDSVDLTPDEKRELAELFDVDPWDRDSDDRDILKELHDRQGEGV